METSVVQSLITAIRKEFANTICEDEVEISPEGAILFLIETEKGRLGFSVLLSEEKNSHTVEIDVSFLSSDEMVTYFSFPELSVDVLQVTTTLQEKICWGSMSFATEDEAFFPILTRIDLLPAPVDVAEYDIKVTVEKLAFLCSEGIFLLPSIETLSMGGCVTEKDIETDFEKCSITLQ